MPCTTSSIYTWSLLRGSHRGIYTWSPNHVSQIDRKTNEERKKRGNLGPSNPIQTRLVIRTQQAPVAEPTSALPCSAICPCAVPRCDGPGEHITHHTLSHHIVYLVQSSISHAIVSLHDVCVCVRVRACSCRRASDVVAGRRLARPR